MSSVQEAAADGQQREESRAADMWSNGRVSTGGLTRADCSGCSSFGGLEAALVVAASTGLQD